MYHQGQGVGKDNQQAIYWFTKAKNQGIDRAKNYLEMMFDEGQGVDQNYEQAFHGQAQAENQRLAEEQFNLGLTYYSGKGVDQNYEQAHHLFMLAAKKQNREAQYYLGVMNEYGQGMNNKNHKQAIDWYRKAAENGLIKANDALEMLDNNCSLVTGWVYRKNEQRLDAVPEGPTSSPSTLFFNGRSDTQQKDNNGKTLGNKRGKMVG